MPCDICRAIATRDKTIVHSNSEIVVIRDTEYRYRITTKKHRTMIGILLNRREMGHISKAIVDIVENMAATNVTVTIKWVNTDTEHGQVIAEIMP